MERKKRPLTADIIKQKRKELKLSQKELAMRVGVGLRFIRDVEQSVSLFQKQTRDLNHRIYFHFLMALFRKDGSLI